MAAPASQVKQCHGPSRLRNEITSEHTDGEHRSEHDPVQVPDSQFFGPETQYDDYHDGPGPAGDTPLSPNSFAILHCNAMQKTTMKEEPTTVNFFSRPTESQEELQSQSNFRPAPVVGFTFGQPRMPSLDPPAKASQPEAEPAGGQGVENHRETTEHPQQSTKTAPVVDVHALAESNQKSVSTAPTVPWTVQNGVDDTMKRSQHRDDLLDRPSKTPPSAQPTGVVAKKHGVAKKSRKGKKALKQQQRGVPWPPRPSAVSAQVPKPSPNIKIDLERRSAVQMVSPASMPEDGGLMQFRPQYTPRFEWQQKAQQEIETAESHFTADVKLDHPKQQGHKLDKAVCNDQRDTQSKPQALQKHAPEHSSKIVSERPNKHPPVSAKHPPKDEWSTFDCTQSTLPLSGEGEGQMPVVGSRSTPKFAESEQPQPHQSSQLGCDVEPVKAVGLKARTHGHDTVDLNGHSLGPSRKTVSSGDHNQGVDTVLHGISDQQPPQHVHKTQKKKLPTLSQRPKAAAFFQQFASSTNDFDQALQTLRAAYFAEQDRKEQEATTQIKHDEEIKGLLQDQVKQFSASAADWKDKYNSLHVNVTQLREKAKTNQKYVAGLQKDHEKLKKSTTILHEDCKKALQQKISDVEHEKEVLQQELEKTLNVVGKGQERLRKMVDEFYMQLIISQSKGRDLAENLTKQTAMYEAEKTKRNDLENRLLSSMQGVQRQLGDHTTNMAEKIGVLQGSVDGIDAKVTQESGVQTCLEALEKLQETPFLTIKDVRKAEDMLRFIHEGVCSKVDALAQTDKTNLDPTGEFRTFIGDQLKTLRSDMLRYDEVVAESHKAQEMNDCLSQQLVAEQQHTQQLNEQLSGFRRNEEELQARTTQLEHKLVEARNKTTKVSTLEQNIEELRQQVRAVQDECNTAKAELEKTEQNLQKRDRKLLDYQKSIEILKDEREKLATECSAKASTAAEMRKTIGEKIRQEFAKSEGVFRNDIHRLTNERDEAVKKIRGHDKLMEAAKARCDEANQRTEEMKQELNAARIEKQETESRLKTIQREVQNDSRAASELTKLKEQLRQKLEELQTKFEAFRKLETASSELESSRANLEVACEQQQLEISQHSAKIESLRHETEVEREEEREKHNAAIKLVQDQKQALVKEKGELQEVLEQTQTNESKLKNARADLVNEREGLRRRTAELEQAKSMAETQNINAQQERNNLIRKHEEELEDLRRRHEQTETALKNAEAKVHLQKAEHSKKIESDFQKYEAKYKELADELEKERAKIWGANGGATANVRHPHSHSVDISQSRKSRKKVNRENQSVLNVGGLSGILVNTGDREPSRDRTGSERHASSLNSQELVDAPGSISGGDELLEDYGLSIIDPAAEQVEDTQIIADLMVPLGEDAKTSRKTSNKEPRERASLPADQSSLSGSLPSDEFALLIDGIEGVHTPKQRKRGPKLLSGRSPEDRVLETPLCNTNGPRSGLRPSQSQERPRSQANTASRMMPPPGSTLYHLGQEQTSPDACVKAVGRGRAHRKEEYSSYGKNSASSGSRRQSSSKTSFTPTGLIDSRIRGDDSTSPSENQHIQKRGAIFDHEGPSKRQRQSSPRDRAEPSSAERSLSSHHFRSNGSRSSDVGAMNTKNQISTVGSSGLQPSRSRNHRSSTSRSSATAYAPRHYSHHQTRSKTQEAERFDQEIRGR